MDTGIAMYAVATGMLADRRHAADHRRLVAQAKAAKKTARRDGRVDSGQWNLEWGGNGFTGKPVTLVNSATGERLTGRDPGDWDRAMGIAMRSLADSPEPVGSNLVA